jgi:hypothetical protein
MAVVKTLKPPNKDTKEQNDSETNRSKYEKIALI